MTTPDFDPNLDAWLDPDDLFNQFAAIDTHQDSCSTCALDGGLSHARDIASKAAADLSPLRIVSDLRNESGVRVITYSDGRKFEVHASGWQRMDDAS